MGDVTNTHPCHDKERTVTDLLNAALPPIPDVPFMIGLGAEHRHAVDIQTARTAADAAAERGPHAGWTHAACGQPVVLARKGGEFRRDNPFLERAADRTCPSCAWTVALTLDRVDEELIALTPHGHEHDVLSRLISDPAVVARICSAILDQLSNDYEPAHPHLVELLAHASRHAPVVLVPEDCAEGCCGHDIPADTHGRCCYPDAALGCAACSVRAGGWAGEWEGQYATECTVTAPCSALSTLAARFGVAL